MVIEVSENEISTIIFALNSYSYRFYQSATMADNSADKNSYLSVEEKARKLSEKILKFQHEIGIQNELDLI